jgi:hypothetical protein
VIGAGQVWPTASGLDATVRQFISGMRFNTGKKWRRVDRRNGGHQMRAGWGKVVTRSVQIDRHGRDPRQALLS